MSLFKSIILARFVWVPLSAAALSLYIYNESSVRTQEDADPNPSSLYTTKNRLSKIWVEDIYRAVGLGASEGLQSSLMLGVASPVYIRNPISDIAIKNNLSIACMQIDDVIHYKGVSDIYVVEGNVTFKGAFEFNSHLNNSVVHIKSFYVNEDGYMTMMSSSIDRSKPSNDFKSCELKAATLSRNIRFDNYLEQMNSLTFKGGYLAPLYPGNLNDLKLSDIYITNDEYFSLLLNEPLEMEIIKGSAMSAGGFFVSLLSLSGILNANNALAKHSSAIDKDIKAQLKASDKFSKALDFRVEYLKRMDDYLECGKSNKHHDVCYIDGEVRFGKDKRLPLDSD